MGYSYDSIYQFQKDVNRIAREVFRLEYNNAYREIIGGSSLFNAIDVKTISKTDTSFSYDVKARKYVSGEAKPASCQSTPDLVHSGGSATFSGFNNLHEIGYELCKDSCKKPSLREDVIENENSTALHLIRILFDRFWIGAPSLHQFGITNHPVIEHIESESNGEKGKSTWASKTNNQIMKELRRACKDMTRPVIRISDNVYEECLGDTYGKDDDKLRIDVVESLLTKDDRVNFNGNIVFSEGLNKHELFGNSNIAVVFDADAVSINASGPIYNAAFVRSGKVLLMNRQINTSGLQIDYEGSVRIITGI